MKFIKKTDLIIILAIVLVAFSVFLLYNSFYSSENVTAYIYHKDKVLREIDLPTFPPEVFSFDENKNVVFEIHEDKSISFRASDCPDQVCVHTGKLHVHGENAACLPNEFFIRLENSQNSEVDIIP